MTITLKKLLNLVEKYFFSYKIKNNLFKNKKLINMVIIKIYLTKRKML